MSDPVYDAKLSDEQRAILDRAAYMVILNGSSLTSVTSDVVRR
jgi:hypothetical protein